MGTLRAGYLPVAVLPQDRVVYLDALELSSVSGDDSPYQSLVHERLDATLAQYLSALETGANPA